MSVTIKDIAKIAEVSIATVSKVINGKTHDIGDETKAHVEQILKEQNYVPNQVARAMRTNSTQSLALIIPDIRNSFFTEIARGAQDEAFKQNYSIFFANSDDKIDKEIMIIDSMIEKRVDGLLIAGSNERDKVKELKMQTTIPAISIDREVNYNFIVSHVFTNNFDVAYKAVEYLIENNHKKIIHLAGPKENIVSNYRVAGYKQALLDHKLPFDEKNIIYGSFTVDSGYEHVSELSNIDFTAIFASNDLISIGATSALKEKGYRVPDDVSMVGVDNISLSQHLSPKLTTMDQDPYNIGKIAVKEMINHLKGKKPQKQLIFNPKLITRESVLKIK